MKENIDYQNVEKEKAKKEAYKSMKAKRISIILICIASFLIVAGIISIGALEMGIVRNIIIMVTALSVLTLAASIIALTIYGTKKFIFYTLNYSYNTENISADVYVIINTLRNSYLYVNGKCVDITGSHFGWTDRFMQYKFNDEVLLNVKISGGTVTAKVNETLLVPENI